MNDYCIYKHTSPSGKVYVGITKSKRKMSESRKGILSGINNPMFGRHETNPAFGKFGKNHPASKIVKQYTKEGIFIRY